MYFEICDKSRAEYMLNTKLKNMILYEDINMRSVFSLLSKFTRLSDYSYEFFPLETNATAESLSEQRNAI